jgi:heme-binding protein
VATGVVAATSTYLYTHPDVNAFFTSLKGQPRDQISDDLQGYLDQNPQVRAELQAIRQPMADFRSRCQ